MPACTVCASARLFAINAALAMGQSTRSVAVEFGLGRGAISRHSRNCRQSSRAECLPIAAPIYRARLRPGSSSTVHQAETASPQRQRQDAIKLRSHGLTSFQIGEFLKVSEPIVKGWLKADNDGARQEFERQSAFDAYLPLYRAQTKIREGLQRFIDQAEAAGDKKSYISATKVLLRAINAEALIVARRGAFDVLPLQRAGSEDKDDLDIIQMTKDLVKDVFLGVDDPDSLDTLANMFGSFDGDDDPDDDPGTAHVRA